MPREIKKGKEPEQTEEPPVITDESVIFEGIVNILAEQEGIKSILGEINNAVIPSSRVLSEETGTIVQKRKKDL